MSGSTCNQIWLLFCRIKKVAEGLIKLVSITQFLFIGSKVITWKHNFFISSIRFVAGFHSRYFLLVSVITFQLVQKVVLCHIENVPYLTFPLIQFLLLLNVIPLFLLSLLSHLYVGLKKSPHLFMWFWRKFASGIHSIEKFILSLQILHFPSIFLLILSQWK